MRWATLVAGAMCVGLGATAVRAQDEAGPAAWAKRFQERALERQAERLGLSTTQKDAFLKAHRDYQAKLHAAAKARDAAINQVLTAEQRATLAEQQRTPFGAMGGFGPGGMRFGRGGRGPAAPPAIASAEALAAKLGLGDEQRAKLDAIYAEYRAAQEKSVGDLDLGDPEALVERAGKIAEQQRAAREARDTRIRELLDAHQREQFDKLAKEADAPMVRSFGLAVGPDGPVVLGGGEDGGDPAAGLEEASKLLKGLLGGNKNDGGTSAKPARLKQDLGLSEDEAMVLWPLVEQIQILQREHDAWRRARQRELRRVSAEGGADVADRLAELREREQTHRTALARLRDELRALVTVTQEAVLVGHGILE